MVKLHGKELSRRDIESLSGDFRHIAGVRKMELSDGTERGIRILEFRSGTGLRFTVLIDRAMDVGNCEHNGRAIGWNSPTGFRHPAFHEYEGEGGLGWLRSFSGLTVTCGLDHTLFMNAVSAENYNYNPRQQANHSLHGRIGTIPARLTGYGERWEGDRCYLWAKGIVTQGAVFGEHLELHRHIEIEVGTDVIRLNDEVVNRGFYKTPHMYCYHINIGHPVLEEGSRYLAPIKDVVWAAHENEYKAQKTGYRTAPAPQMNFHEQVWQHEMASDQSGKVPVALVNDRLNIGLQVTTLKDQFPCLYEWQNYQAGQYAFGIEPSSHHVLGNQAARDRNEMIWLNHGDSKLYNTEFEILTSKQAIANSETKIRAIAQQPREDFPPLSNNFLQIGGRN